MKRSDNDRRVVGEPWSFLGINTWVYESTVAKAVEAVERLENQQPHLEGFSEIGLSRQSTLKAAA